MPDKDSQRQVTGEDEASWTRVEVEEDEEGEDESEQGEAEYVVENAYDEKQQELERRQGKATIGQTMQNQSSSDTRYMGQTQTDEDRQAKAIGMSRFFQTK